MKNASTTLQVSHGACEKATSEPFGQTYQVWLRLQSGQEKVVRFGQYVKMFDGKLRHQTGYDHASSINFLCMTYLLQMRPYIRLDELLITRACQIHDIPEGLLERDIPLPFKKGHEDLEEYKAFRDAFEALGIELWSEYHRCFLLQWALEDHPDLPPDARKILLTLRNSNQAEALFFEGLQKIDYLYYAVECEKEHGINRVLQDITKQHFGRIEEISEELRGFGEVVWTTKRRLYFESYL
ncbi:MAG: hypothetical protein WC648_03365 [Candidatus Paceibacterota bacterium]|jgi:5'-deoxynucleotidase YfbR-like HD superfamily hydrolase